MSSEAPFHCRSGTKAAIRDGREHVGTWAAKYNGGNYADNHRQDRPALPHGPPHAGGGDG